MTEAIAPGPADASLLSRLNSAAESLGLDLSASQAERLCRYLQALQRWNKVYNLTAVRDIEQMLTLHLIDCLAMIGPLRRHAEQFASLRLLDVGSGAGLPGVVIAALNPNIEVTCIDSVGKKAAFVQQVSTELSLVNLHSVHARVEHLSAPPFHVIASRAFASLSDFVALSRGLLETDGQWLAMKGKTPADELAQLPPDIDVFHVEPLIVPQLAAERCLVWMRITR